MRLLSGISTNERYARKIYDTGLFSVLCLSLTDVYDEATDKKVGVRLHFAISFSIVSEEGSGDTRSKR